MIGSFRGNHGDKSINYESDRSVKEPKPSSNMLSADRRSMASMPFDMPQEHSTEYLIGANVFYSNPVNKYH